MALEDLEVSVGGKSFKGIYLAILLSFGSTLGGGIYASAGFFNRLDTLELTVGDATGRADVIEARFVELKESQNTRLQEYQVSISNMRQQLEDNDVAGLSSSLSELGANLEAILRQQQNLIDLPDRVAAVEKSNSETVLSVDGKIKALEGVEIRMNRLQRDVDDIWRALDAAYLGN